MFPTISSIKEIPDFSIQIHHSSSQLIVFHRFYMCLVLFGTMGINWVMEIVSWAAGGSEYIWYFTDCINTLQGVVIFLIFVSERRVWACVRKHWGPKLSDLYNRCIPSHAKVSYSTPEDAAVRLGM
jgi:hypothetical protein